MKHHLILTPLLLLALLPRLYRVNEPLADWHSWRQADTAAVTRRYIQEGIDLLRPRYDDVSSIPSGKENPHGYRMVEFPFVNGLTAGLYQLIPGDTNLEIHVFSRLVSIAFSLGSLIFLYLLIYRLTNQLTAASAAATFALLPYNIFFSRTILPEVPLVFFSLGMMYFFVRGPLWLSAIFSALSMLLKPYTIFLFLPLAYWQVKKKLSSPSSINSVNLIHLVIPLTLFTFLSLIPFLLWRLWIQQFPEGIPAFTWLLNGNGIRFKGAWFRWLFADRLGRLILGYFGLIPFTLGIVVKPAKTEGWFYHFWLLSILIYFSVFATGNVQHDYYQIIAVPIISLFVAKGIMFLLHPPPGISRITSYGLLITVIAFTLAFSWFHIRDYFNINHPEIVAAGQAADQILSQDAKVIAPYQGDTAFLYQINRRGWPIGGSIEEKIKLGATDYITTTFDAEAQDLMNNCSPVLKTDIYAIINLHSCSL